MKAALALIAIYIAAFLIAVQGSQNPVQAAPQNGAAQDQASAAQQLSLDPAKEADIRSLMELVGAHDMVQDAVTNSTEQYREKLLSTVPNNDKGEAFVNEFADSYQKNFDVDQVTSQLVTVYDRHFTDDEIKGLLQFYGSPLGQKFAAEMPKISREIQAASRAEGMKAAKEALQSVKAQYPELGQSARLGANGGRRWQRGRRQQDQSQQASQQPDPQQP